MDDLTLFSAFKDGLDHLLAIAREFYFLNNICANFFKYELISSVSYDTDFPFALQSAFNGLLPESTFILHSLKKKSSFCFLSVWFNLFNSPSFVTKQITNIYQQFSQAVRSKKLFLYT